MCPFTYNIGQTLWHSMVGTFRDILSKNKQIDFPKLETFEWNSVFIKKRLLNSRAELIRKFKTLPKRFDSDKEYRHG